MLGNVAQVVGGEGADTDDGDARADGDRGLHPAARVAKRSREEDREGDRGDDRGSGLAHREVGQHRRTVRHRADSTCENDRRE